MVEMEFKFWEKAIHGIVGMLFFVSMASSVLWFPYLLGWLTFKLGYNPFGVDIMCTGLLLCMIIMVCGVIPIIIACGIASGGDGSDF